MRVHFENAAYGMLDYLAYPVGMIAAAPVVLRALGVDRYGVWMVASAAVMVGGVIASGFGDANIRGIALHDATSDRESRLRTVRSTLGIHLALGAAIAVCGWLTAPWLSNRVTAFHPELNSDCLWSLRLASLLMFARAVETVCVSTQRALGRYGTAVTLSLAARMASLAAACILPLFFPCVSSILIATTILCSLGTWLQFRQLKRLFGVQHLHPRFGLDTTRSLFAFGLFTWLQAIAGLLFGQVDRLIAGAAFGAAAVSSYALCAQLCQPVYGMSAAGLHFLFPYLTAKEGMKDTAALRRGVLGAFSANAIFVALSLTALLLFGIPILRFWGGETIARDSARMLPKLAWSAALSGLAVTANYAMLALGRVATVTFLNLSGGIVMLGSTAYLLPHFGVEGMAWARLLYAPFTLLIYVPLFRHLAAHRQSPYGQAGSPVCEEV